jgi:hypothetical protein
MSTAGTINGVLLSAVWAEDSVEQPLPSSPLLLLKLFGCKYSVSATVAPNEVAVVAVISVEATG